MIIYYLKKIKVQKIISDTISKLGFLYLYTFLSIFIISLLLGATTIKDMGKVMNEIRPLLTGLQIQYIEFVFLIN